MTTNDMDLTRNLEGDGVIVNPRRWIWFIALPDFIRGRTAHDDLRAAQPCCPGPVTGHLEPP